MLVFDRHSLRCVVPPTDDCDIPSTPPPPQPEEDEDNLPENNPKNKQAKADLPNLPPGAIPVPAKNRQRN